MHTLPQASTLKPFSIVASSHAGKSTAETSAAVVMLDSAVSTTPITASRTLRTGPAAALDQLAHLQYLKVGSKDNKLRIVIIHGDPAKPNDILPGGRWDEDDFYTIERAREAMKALEYKYEFTWLCSHDTLMDDLRKLKREEKVDLVLQVSLRHRDVCLIVMISCAGSCVMKDG